MGTLTSYSFHSVQKTLLQYGWVMPAGRPPIPQACWDSEIQCRDTPQVVELRCSNQFWLWFDSDRRFFCGEGKTHTKRKELLVLNGFRASKS